MLSLNYNDTATKQEKEEEVEERRRHFKFAAVAATSDRPPPFAAEAIKLLRPPKYDDGEDVPHFPKYYYKT